MHSFSDTCLSLYSLSSPALDTALVGLALTYVVSLSGMLQYCIRQSAEVENLVSVLLELCQQYTVLLHGTDGVSREGGGIW